MIGNPILPSKLPLIHQEGRRRRNISPGAVAHMKKSAGRYGGAFLFNHAQIFKYGFIALDHRQRERRRAKIFPGRPDVSAQGRV